MKINKYLAVFISAAILMSCVPSMAFASDTDDMVTEETEETEATEASDGTEATGATVDEQDAPPPQASDDPEPAPEEETVTAEGSVDHYDDAATADPVRYEYNHYDFDTHEIVREFPYCSDYTLLSDVADTGSVTLTNGKWYVLDSNRTYNNRIEISGAVSIILRNDKKLTCKNGIHVGTNAVLNIFCEQRYLGDTLGTLHAEVDLSDNSPIGGNVNEKAGVINIYSGKIEAIAYSSQSASIGGGHNTYNVSEDNGSAKSINIYGGEISAINNNNGAAIGGGRFG